MGGAQRDAVVRRDGRVVDVGSLEAIVQEAVTGEATLMSELRQVW
jgi:hypothetical protein